MQDTRSHYDAISHWYDLLTGLGEGRARSIGLNLLRPEEGDTLLEIGCGTGQALLPLARSVGERGGVYGIDLSQGMLARAQRRIVQHEFSQRIRLLAGDARCQPFSSGFVDAIWISFTLELFSSHDITRVLSECRRILASDGKLCVVALARTANAGPMSKLYDWLHVQFPRWIDCSPISLQALLLQAGFIQEEVEEISLWGLPVEIVLAHPAEMIAGPLLMETRKEA